MTKIEQAEQWLRGGPPKIWQTYDSFSIDDRMRLLPFPKASVEKLFHAAPPEGNSFQATQVQCGTCGAVDDYHSLSKSKLIRLIYEPQDWMCVDCSRKLREEEQDRFKRRDGAWMEEKQKHVSTFFEDYLSPNKEWNTLPKTWFNEVQYVVQFCRKDEVKAAICAMKYRDFLRTPYWKAVAQQVRYRARFRCQLCNADGPTHVHHRHYETHGMEHENLHDLICLCAKCHTTHHAK